jgi:hypothetical protein
VKRFFFALFTVAGLFGAWVLVQTLAKQPPKDQPITIVPPLQQGYSSPPAPQESPGLTLSKVTAASEVRAIDIAVKSVALSEPGAPNVVRSSPPEPSKETKVEGLKSIRQAPFSSLPVGESTSFDISVDETLSREWSLTTRDEMECDLLLSAMIKIARLPVSSQGDPLRNRLAICRTDEIAGRRPLERTLLACQLHEAWAIVLIPPGAERQQKADIAKAADQLYRTRSHRKGTLVVIQYEIRPDKIDALLTRQPDVPVECTFTEAYGYREAAFDVKGSYDGLREFLGKVDNVVFISPPESQDAPYIIGGRRLPGLADSGLSPMGALVVWRAEQRIAELHRQTEITIDIVRTELEEEYSRLERNYTSTWSRKKTNLERNDDRTAGDIAAFEAGSAADARKAEMEMKRLARQAAEKQAAAMKTLKEESEAIWKAVPKETLLEWESVRAIPE